ncbi:hypothetical protein AQ616_13475 [Oceanobacillus sp. E9]|uniref:HAAS signaling domain-containing protein n=1 Tax=Oceanobacillus sp. E9 TaxID=1742575 RepID=UPI00084E4B7C|nr:DUF1700 domain-containing protein [Oceanobacillus sp. E9]OEH53507.1 hypothetical protein AQ616_13475 [Oceanobacillus sp. E9]
MNKHEFLQKLQAKLTNIPDHEQKEITRDIEEHFIAGLEEGKTEEQIADSLGSPQQLAKDVTANYHVEKVNQNTSSENIFRATWAVLGLGFLNVVIVLGPLLVVASIVISLWTVSASFVFQFIALIVKVIITPSAFQLFELFFSITLVGLGLLLGIAMYYVSKYLIHLFIRYLNFNIRIVKGGASK